MHKESKDIEKDPSFKELQNDINKIGFQMKEMGSKRQPNEFVVNHRREQCEQGSETRNEKLQQIVYLQQKAGINADSSLLAKSTMDQI